MFPLDPRTLIFFSTAMALLLLVLLVGVSAAQAEPRGFGAWKLAQVAGLAGGILIAARGPVPLFLSIVLGNLLVFAGQWFLVEGFLRFYDLPRRVPLWLDLAVILGADVALALRADGSVNARILTVSALSVWLAGRLGLEPLRAAEGRRSRAQQALAALCLVAVALFAVRIGWALRAPRFTDFWQEGWTGAVPGLLLTAVNGTAMLTAVFLTHERSERALRAALSEVKALSGLLPICMHCHSIRNDQGYWHQLERYLAEHTSATFSHGICPACYEKMFASRGRGVVRPGRAGGTRRRARSGSARRRARGRSWPEAG